MRPDLGTALDHEDPRVRLNAILEAGHLTDVAGHSALVDGLVARLWDDHPGVRQAALEILGRLSNHAGLEVDVRVVKRAVELTRDERPGVRGQAAASLALVGLAHTEIDRAAVLTPLLNDPVPTVREEVLAALGDLQAVDAADAIARQLDDPAESVRFEAAFALASLKDDRGRAQLEAALLGARRRLDACEALRRLKSPNSLGALRAISTRWFLSWADRLTVWATMFVLGDASAEGKILDRSKSRNRAERTYALSLIGSHRLAGGRAVLERVARDSKDALQDTAVRALGELGDPGSVSVLETIAETAGTPEELRDDARRALAQIAKGRQKSP